VVLKVVLKEVRRVRIARSGILLLGALFLAVSTVASQPGPIRFSDATAQTIGFMDAPDWGFIAVGDLDGDGWDDLILNGHSGPGIPPGIRRYRNNKNGTFTVVPLGLPAPTPQTVHRHVLVLCDLDRDGDEDLFVGTGIVDQAEPALNEDLWLRNDGGTFSFDMAPGLETTDPGSNVWAATCLDADRNGWPDILIDSAAADVLEGYPHHSLWMNYGMSFENEAKMRGLNYPRNSPAHPYALACAAFLASAWPSCISTGNNHPWWYVANGPGSFSKTTEDSRIPRLSPYLHDAAIADFNGDGFLDAAVVDVSRFLSFASDVMVLWIYRGNGTKLDNGVSSRFVYPLPNKLGEMRSLAVGDFDNDGAPDAFITMGDGMVIDGISAKGPDLLLQNDGTGKFVDVAKAAGIQGPVGTKLFGGGGAAVMDYDKDGRLDIIVGYNDVGPVHRGPFRLYRNVTQNGNAWVGFILRKPVTLGAWVEVTSCGKKRVQQLNARTGWLAQDSRNVHFGLGSCNQAPSVKIKWPDGTVSDGVVPANAYYTVPPLSPDPGPPPPDPTPTPGPTPTPHPTPAPAHGSVPSHSPAVGLPPAQITAPDRPPQVKFVFTQHEATVQKPLWVMALAVDDRGIRRVTIDVDGVQLALATKVATPPYYAALWETREARWAPGWHTVTVTATDTGRQTVRQSMKVFLRK